MSYIGDNRHLVIRLGVSRAWVLRPALWFATAYTLIIIVHEAAHALVGVSLGIPSTLFNFWVNHDFSAATPGERAAVGIAGPVVSLLAGLACWFIYRRVRDSAIGLPLLYLAAFGVTNFFGNLMSVSFVGDFSNAAAVLGVPQPARYVVSVTGAVAVATTLYATGRELRQWAPDRSARLAAVVWLIVVPALAGTAFIILINQPTPMGASFATARAGEGAFWVFAALGALLTKYPHTADDARLRIRWTDGAAAVLAALVVKAMASGITLRP